jgi:hypothetical protein
MPTRPPMLAAFRAYIAARPLPQCVSPAVPVLYFGDESAYRASPKHIISVALNPSLAEFPTPNPWQRFPAGSAVYPTFSSAPATLSNYKSALDRYFDVDPYHWFRHLKPALEGFDASFWPGRTNRALHTDLMTPVPTNPVWSGLKTTPAARAVLMSAGVPLWLDLVRELQPDIALVSMARHHLAHIVFAGVVKPWTAVHPIPVHWKSGPTSYLLEHQVVQVGRTYQMDVVFGPQLRQPFGGLTDLQKAGIGPALRGKLTNW